MEPTFLTILVNQLAPLFAAVIAGLVAVAIARFNKWVRTKTDSEEILTTMDSVFNIAETAVADANATVVAGLKEAAADGKITEEEAKDIKDKVFKQIKDTIPTKSAKVLSKVVADLDANLMSLIEKLVQEAKLNQ
jgi:polyhydroxyalkanoate synthesis regulator phasin